MKRVIGGFPILAVVAALAHAAPTAAPICPHCRNPVGPTLDEQHRHATARCIDPNPENLDRHRAFLDRQFERVKRERAQREQADAAERAAKKAAAEKRIANANAKRARKAARRTGAKP